MVKKAIELEQEVDFYTAKTIPFAKVFVVFDKDSFNDDQFNEAINMCNRNGYVALWSNQAIEYWFLLHFGKVDCKMDRRDYEKKINKQYKHNEKYLKNDSNTYHYINKYGNVNNAIKHAKSIHKFFLENEITPAKSESCTTVYKIFEYLKELIDVKQL